jgi:putative transcriptional regulator
MDGLGRGINGKLNWRTISSHSSCTFEKSPVFSLPDSVPLATMEERDDDWRAFRAKLVKSQQEQLGGSFSSADEEQEKGTTSTLCGPDDWAHVLAGPEKGCLLLANPLMFTTGQTYFNKAVILLFGHGAEGSAGVIVNKPTQHLMGEFNGTSTLSESYDECKLYLGGDVGAEVLNILHGVDGVEGTNQVVPGVYMGGVDGVAQALACGNASPSDVKLLTRYAGWGPGQLEEEVRRGVWIVAAASRDVILGRYTLSEPALEGDNVWHHVLQLMGGDYAGLSEAVREDFREDIMGAVDPEANVDVDPQGPNGSSNQAGNDQEGEDLSDDEYLGGGI